MLELNTHKARKEYDSLNQIFAVFVFFVTSLRFLWNSYYTKVLGKVIRFAYILLFLKTLSFIKKTLVEKELQQ